MLQAGFIYFALVIVFCALMVITRRNPVHSVLFMLPLFFHVAGLFIMLDAEFVAAVQVLVYAGAIMVLFLFVVMLLNVERDRERQRSNFKWAFTIPFGAMLAGFLMIILLKSDFTGVQGEYTAQAVSMIGNSQAVGRVLYTDFLFPFEVASIILLVAMVGAIVLAKKKID